MSHSSDLKRFSVAKALIILLVLGRIGWSQPSACIAVPDTICLNPEINSLVAVGKDVTTLDGTLKICLGEICAIPEYAPIRVILVIDQSVSMCRNTGECCVPGDSTYNCMTNDPDDKRIIAAHRFVDSLAQRNPTNEVGIVAFDTRTELTNPVSLDSDASIASVHRRIDAASCAANHLLAQTYQPSASPTLAKNTAVKTTNIGLALDVGLKAADYNFSKLNDSTSRHIILLTDGAWEDTASDLMLPDSIIGRYRTSFPTRSVPTIHGIFLSNAELHTAHGYPAEGCANQYPVNLDKLELITTLTGGLYFAGTTPSTIVDNFISINRMLRVDTPQQSASISLSNATTTKFPLKSTILSVGTSNILEVTFQSIPLEYGLNTISLTRIFRSPDVTDLTTTTTYSIFRDTQNRSAPETGPFRIHCQSGLSAGNNTIQSGLPGNNRQKQSKSFLNLLGKKVGESNFRDKKTSTGLYLKKDEDLQPGKRSVTVK